ncbi:MAG: serine hydrolase domain-containing protein [Thermoanaerobaculia bacterium]
MPGRSSRTGRTSTRVTRPPAPSSTRSTWTTATSGPAGGFLSTTEDLMRFAEAMREGRLLRPETVKLLWTSQRTREGKETAYGIGWGVEKDDKGRRRVSHSGGSQGGTANLILFPGESGLAVAMLVNSDHSFTSRAIHLATLFLDGEEGLRRWESREAGFALRCPESWAGRVAPVYLTGKDVAEQHPKAVGAARFRFMRSGEGRPEPILTVLVFESRDWRALAREGKALPGSVLANRGGRTWVAVLPKDNPYAAGSPDQKAFDEMRVDLGAIESGFQLLSR